MHAIRVYILTAFCCSVIAVDAATVSRRDRGGDAQVAAPLNDALEEDRLEDEAENETYRSRVILDKRLPLMRKAKLAKPDVRRVGDPGTSSVVDLDALLEDEVDDEEDDLDDSQEDDDEVDDNSGNHSLLSQRLNSTHAGRGQWWWYSWWWWLKDRGPTGPKGYPGSKGAVGLVGNRGAAGDRGNSGSSRGPRGWTGWKGSKGSTGYPGIAGSKGPPGINGPKGRRGNQGPEGRYEGQGSHRGPQGDQGPTGVRGPIGSVGQTGQKGLPGETGMEGWAGAIGPAGQAGPRGTLVGPKGIPGTPAQIKKPQLFTIIDCKWGDWTHFTVCPVTCGGSSHGALQSRTRKVLVESQNGGDKCPGNKFEDQVCATQACPDARIHCAWSSWAEWTECTRTCSGGKSNRERYVMVEVQNGGDECTGVRHEAKDCNLGACEWKAKDCVWYEWNAWSECSATCGGGYSKRVRSIKTYPEDGGAHCQGPTVASNICGSNVCPIVEAAWALVKENNYCGNRGSRNGEDTYSVKVSINDKLDDGVNQCANFVKHRGVCGPVFDYSGETGWCQCVPVWRAEKSEECALVADSSYNVYKIDKAWQITAATTSTTTRLELIRMPRGGKGKSGVPGEVGAEGALGLQGPRGMSGAPGLDGLIGENGTEGPAGANGTPATLLQPIDCLWASWNDWGACSATCGSRGLERKERYYQVWPQNNGTLCEGHSFFLRSCQLEYDECPNATEERAEEKVDVKLNDTNDTVNPPQPTEEPSSEDAKIAAVILPGTGTGYFHDGETFHFLNRSGGPGPTWDAPTQEPLEEGEEIMNSTNGSSNSRIGVTTGGVFNTSKNWWDPSIGAWRVNSANGQPIAVAPENPFVFRRRRSSIDSNGLAPGPAPVAREILISERRRRSAVGEGSAGEKQDMHSDNGEERPGGGHGGGRNYGPGGGKRKFGPDGRPMADDDSSEDKDAKASAFPFHSSRSYLLIGAVGCAVSLSVL